MPPRRACLLPAVPGLTCTNVTNYVTNYILRLRLYFLSGGQLTDFGEKQNDRRLELRMRYYF